MRPEAARIIEASARAHEAHARWSQAALNEGARAQVEAGRDAGLADGALIDAVRDAPTTAAVYMQELRAALIECRSALQRVKPQARGVLVVQDIDYALERSMRAMLGTELWKRP